MNRKILLGFTTTRGSSIEGKLKEIDEFKIKEIALFPTVLKIKERKKLYNSLEKTGIKKIPHVHARDDFEKWEMDYLIKNYHTRVFNIHPNEKCYSFVQKNKKYRDRVFVENLETINDMFIKILNSCKGICLDVSHYHDYGIMRKDKGYRGFEDLLKKFKVGCSHVSAAASKPGYYNPYETGKKELYYSKHVMGKVDELSYVKKYVKYMPRYVSIELANSFKEQLEAKKYLENFL